MGNVVNLRMVRKAKRRETAETSAAVARARSGRTVADKKAERMEDERRARVVDGARLDTPPSRHE